MGGIKGLNKLLYRKDLKNKISKSNNRYLEFSYNLQSVVEGDLLVEINKLLEASRTEEEERFLVCISLFLAQAIKTYKSCIILLKEGYYQNALINLRNMVEILFNINYIVQDDQNKYKLSTSYLSNNSYWAGKELWQKANLALEKPMYEIYKFLCNYTHANYSATYSNLSVKGLSCNPENNRIGGTLELVNSVYYYLVEDIYNILGIDKSYIEYIEKPQYVIDNLRLFNKEKHVLSWCEQQIKKHCSHMNDEEIKSFNRQFREHTAKKQKKRSN